MSESVDNKDDNGQESSTKKADGQQSKKEDETRVQLNPSGQLFDKKQLNICADFIELSKKNGHEMPSNDHIKKWIDKPQGTELRRAIHATLANMVREAKFDSHPPDTTITKSLLNDILNLSNKCEFN